MSDTKWRRPRSEMSEAERQRARKQAQWRGYMASQGKSLNVDAAATIRHILYLNERGMSFEHIATNAGIHTSTVVSLLTRPPNKVHPRCVRRTTQDKILAVQFEQPTDKTPGKLGAKRPAIGVKRRVQALVAAGYPYKFLAQRMGYGDAVESVRQMATREKYTWAHHLTVKRINALYEELQYDKPSEHGITPYGEKRAKGVAAKYRFPPPQCWDTDTIDDPRAIAEWTGRCGSERGYRIHLREGIPTCQPCRDAHAERPHAEREHLNPAKLIAAREAVGWSRSRLARELGVDSANITHWERGRCSPVPATADRLHFVLGVEDGALFMDDDEEGEW